MLHSHYVITLSEHTEHSTAEHSTAQHTHWPIKAAYCFSVGQKYRNANYGITENAEGRPNTSQSVHIRNC